MAVIGKRKWRTASGEQREAWKLDFTDVTGERHREQFAKKKDAEARLQELMAKTSTGTHRPEGEKKTVRDAAESFIKAMTKRHERGEKVTLTYLNTSRQHCQNWIDPDGEYVPEKSASGRKLRLKATVFDGGIGDVRLPALTAKRVIEFRDAMRDAGAGVVTTRRVLGTLSRILKHAVEQDMVTTNVAKGVRVIGTRDEGPEKVTPPSKAALASILTEADDKTKLMIQFAASSGLRASEQWALRWRHVDLDAKTITVESRVDIYGGFDTTKSNAGQRTVRLGQKMADALATHKEASSYKSDDDFVFADSKGGFTRHTNMLKRKWNPLTKKVGQAGLGWHSLRHFAISTWIEAGLQPKAVQTLAGHATFAITMNRYGHLFPSDDHQDVFDKVAETLA